MAWEWPPSSDDFMTASTWVYEFADIRVLAETMPFPHVFLKLADIVDESETYGTWGAFHFVMWVRNWLQQAMVGDAGLEWYDACLPWIPAPTPSNSTFNTVPLDAVDNSRCKAAAEYLERHFLPAISLEGHPWQDGVLDWWRAHQTQILPFAMKLMNGDKEGAEEELRVLLPPDEAEERQMLQEIRNQTATEFCDYCEECVFVEYQEIKCRELYTLLTSIAEAERPGLRGATHFVGLLIPWVIVHNNIVLYTPHLQACFSTDTEDPPKTHIVSNLARSAAFEATKAKPSCTKAYKKMAKSLQHVTENKNLPWQPAVHPWWEQHQQDLLVQIAIVHVVASDDFDDYMMWVAKTPNVPDTSKDASYLAAQKIYQLVNNSEIFGQWGAYHLVSRV